jgi:hypothetical protein
MPKRVIDFDAMWGSDKLASCAAWAQAEYAWLYGLADASGCFEVTNLRVIWGRVAAIRGNFTIERLEQVFAEFQDKGLLFVWEHEGKKYAHWTGSDVPGRLPPPSWRMRLEKFAPPVPRQQLAAYMSRFARGRAALGGVGFRGGAELGSGRREEDLRFQGSDFREAEETAKAKEDPRNAAGGGLKGRVEEAQAQDLNLGLDWELNEKREVESGGTPGWPEKEIREGKFDKPTAFHSNSPADSNSKAKSNGPADSSGVNDGNSRTISSTPVISTGRAAIRESANSSAGSPANSYLNSSARPGESAAAGLRGNDGGTRTESDKSRVVTNGSGLREFGAAAYASSAKEMALARELRVGQGPVCGPIRVRAEVLERVRQRDAARAKAGTRSP